MSRYNMNVLADAKEEYTRQLISVISPEIYVGIKSIYDAAQSHCSKIKDKNVLKKFQVLLSSVPQWNQSKVEAEFERIVKKTDCDFIEDLITAVFVSHTKVLSSIKLKKNNKTIPVNVPVGAYFIHKCYIECARNFWRKAWLLDNTARSIDIQRNVSDSERLIQESIKETIRKLLPVRYILKEYIDQDYTDDEINDNIEESLSKTARNNLRKLVRNELQTLSKSSFDDNYSTLEIPNDDNELPNVSDNSKLSNTQEKEAQTMENILEPISSESCNKEHLSETEHNKDVEINSNHTGSEENFDSVKNTLEVQDGGKIIESNIEDNTEDTKEKNQEKSSDIENVQNSKEEENLEEDKNIKVIESKNETLAKNNKNTQDNMIIIEKVSQVNEEKKSMTNEAKSVYVNETESNTEEGTVDDKTSELQKEIINLDNTNKNYGDSLIESDPIPRNRDIIENPPVPEPEDVIKPEATTKPEALTKSEDVVKPEAVTEAEALTKSEDVVKPEAVVEPEPSVEPEATVQTEAFKEQRDAVGPSELEKPKIYDNLNDYTTLDNDAKVLKDKVEQEDIDHLETLSNKTAIRELKESIKESHKSEEKVVDDFSFFEDAVRFQ